MSCALQVAFMTPLGVFATYAIKAFAGVAMFVLMLRCVLHFSARVRRRFAAWRLRTQALTPLLISILAYLIGFLANTGDQAFPPVLYLSLLGVLLLVNLFPILRRHRRRKNHESRAGAQGFAVDLNHRPLGRNIASCCDPRGCSRDCCDLRDRSVGCLGNAITVLSLGGVMVVLYAAFIAAHEAPKFELWRGDVDVDTSFIPGKCVRILSVF